MEILVSILKDAQLESYAEAAIAWCEEQGAETAGEVGENFDDFAEGLGIDAAAVEALGRVFEAHRGLHKLAAAGDVAALKELVCPSSLEVEDERGQRALHAAAAAGQAEAATVLLEAGCARNPRDASGRMPLHYAAYAGHVPAVEALLDKEARPDVKEPKQESTPLHAAARQGHVEVVEALLNRGAYIEPRCTVGRDPLHWASFWGQPKTAAVLIERGAINGPGNQEQGNGAEPLHWAAWRGHIEVMQVLVDRGAEANTRSVQRSTPMHFAAEGGHSAALNFLLDLGANHMVQNEDGESPLQLALHRTESGHASPSAWRPTDEGDHREVVKILQDLPLPEREAAARIEIRP